MKKTILSAVMLIAATMSFAQVDLQLHYDFGRMMNRSAEPERPQVTTTVEMFKPDKLGSTFFFVDFDYYSNGVAGAYWEISREFTALELDNHNSFAAHVEYNGGLSINKSLFPARFQPAALLGGAWNWHNTNFSSTFSFQVMYKQFFRQTMKGVETPAVSGFQTTAVWSTTFADGKVTFDGFADLWYGHTTSFDDKGVQKKGLVFLTEPQIWYNATSQLSIGSEVELSNNFVYGANDTKFFVNPTLAVKWKF